MLRYMKLLLATAAFVLTVPALASAATICVQKPECTGTDRSTFESALQAAEDNGPGEDRIELGAGRFTPPNDAGWVNDPGSDVKVVGMGRRVTTLAGRDNGYVLELNDPRSSISDLSIRFGNGSIMVGLQLFGLAERLAVSAPSDVTVATGVDLENGGVIRDSSVAFATGATGGDNRGVRASGDGTAEDVSVAARTAFVAGQFATLTLRRATAVATYGVTAEDGTATVEDAALRLVEGQGGIDPIGLNAETNAGSLPSELTARHVTLVGDDSAGSIGMAVRANNGFLNIAANSSLVASDSIVRNFATHLEREGVEDCEGTTDCNANMTVQYSDYDFSKTDVAETGTNAGGFSGAGARNNVDNVDPRFLSASSLRLRYDSPLIDIGTPGLIPSGESQTDAAGRARLRDGKAPFNGRRRDMGAFEYQRLAPTARAGASPGSVRPGQKATFDATGSSDPDGDPLGFLWRFDDDTNLAGAIAEKRFDTGGEHTGTVTVTDPTGLSDTASVTLSDEFAPELGVDSLSVKGRTARVKLDCDEGEGEDCEGSISVRSLGRIELSAKKKVKLGSRRFDLDPGQTRTVKVKLRKKMLRRIERRKLRLRIVVTAKDDAGNRVTLKRKRTLKLKRSS